MLGRLTRRTCALSAILGCIALAAVHLGLSLLPSQAESYPVATTGSFRAQRSGAAELAPGIALWASDVRGGPGSVTLGPFPAPDRLRIAARGDPAAAGQSLYLALDVINARIPLALSAPAGKWGIIDCELPSGWRGRLITLQASTGPGNAACGLAFTQPYGRGTGGTRSYGLMETLCAWLANGLLYGLVFVGLASALARRQWVAHHWVPLAAAAAVALLGYGAFWAYFATPVLGRLYSAAVLFAALFASLRGDGRFEARDREWLSAGCAAAAIGFVYIGVFHLFPANRDFYDLASNRFVVGMPGDGRLTFDFADLLYHGQRPVELGAGWLSSDRPPLQEGWQLLGWPGTAAMGLSDQTASATAAVWFQLSWVFALYGILRSLRMAAGRAILWTMAASLNGFFLIHSLFTWPKLSAGAFVCGTLGMWMLGGSSSRPRGRILGTLFAGLALLSHGGAAFTLAPLAPWVAWRCLKGEMRSWLLAALAFALLAVPWAAYQHCFAPPGNRLLKWHLAGQSSVDDKPVGQTIAEAYRGMSWSQVLERDAGSVAFQFGGDWTSIASASAASAADRRMDEYYHTFRAMGWWNLAVPILGLSALGLSYRRRLWETSRRQAFLLAWGVASMALWCALLFTRTEIPHGSLAVMIVVFALYSHWIELAGRWGLPCLVILQAYTLAGTWMRGNPVVNGAVSMGAVLVIGASLAAAAWGARRLAAGEGPGTG